MQFDSLAIGDYSYDVFFKIHDAQVQDGKLVIGYGAKIVADEIHETVGGNACNNAVGLSRLGKKVTFYSVSGDDDYRKKMKLTLVREGVDGSSLVDLPRHQSNLAAVINFQGEKTQIIYHDKHTYEVTEKLPVTPWLYLSSVGADYEKFFADLAVFTQKNNVKLCFNPASHQLSSSVTTYESILKSSHILFMNKEEAARILNNEKNLEEAAATLSGAKTNQQLQALVKEMMVKLKEYGPVYVVVTDGPAGSYSFDGKIHRYIGIWEDFPVVERTGCGDAYASGFTCAMMNGENIAEVMRWGSFNGGSVVTRVGPQAGLLHLAEMKEYLQKSPGFKAVEI